MVWIALSIIGSSMYQAGEARKSRQSAERNQEKALLQQQADAEAMRAELAKQTSEYAKQGASLEQQAQTAKLSTILRSAAVMAARLEEQN